MEAHTFDYEGFSAFLLINNRKNSSVERHLYSLKRIAGGVATFSKSEVDTFFARLKSEGKRGAYLNSLVNTVCVYAQFKNVPELQKYKRFKEEEFIKATMSDEEIEAFLSLPCPYRRGTLPNGQVVQRRYDIKGYNRWTLFFQICAYTGMRMGEVAHLTLDDCDFGRMVFTVRESKTGFGRVVPIPPNIELSLREYLETSQHHLFPGADDVDWNYNFQTRIKRLGIRRKNLTPYSLRHSLITRLLEEDVNLFKVQKLVGHRRIDTTAQYTHLTTKDIQEAIKKHPIIRRATDPRTILLALVNFFNSLHFDRDNRFKYKLEETEKGVKIEVEIKD